MPQKQIATNAGDAIAAGSAVGFGVHLLANVELIVSIIAGVLVAASAALSIYLNWRDRVKEKNEENSDAE